jgi:hypothetical protein
MTPEEITEALRPYGQHIARSTLTQYARIGVIGSPTVRSLGRGRGSLSEYPPEAPAEIVAARTLVGTTGFDGSLFPPGRVFPRITLELLAAVRHFAYKTTTGELLEAIRKADEEGDRTPLEALTETTDPLRFIQVLQLWLPRRAWVLHKLPEPPKAGFMDSLYRADPKTLVVSLYDP